MRLYMHGFAKILHVRKTCNMHFLKIPQVEKRQMSNYCHTHSKNFSTISYCHAPKKSLLTSQST